MRTHTFIAGLIGALAMVWLAAPTFAASPELQLVLPRGGQRGTQIELTLRGRRLADAQDILVYSPGLTVSHVAIQKDGSIAAHLAIAKDARIGEYALRVRTATGISDLKTFWVTPYPVVDDTGKSGNRNAAHAMPIDMNVTVMGHIQNDSVNYYRLHADKGQRISVEVVGIRLATAAFDPFLQILGSDGKAVLLTCDDSVFGLADPVATMIAPYAGTYYLAVRDSSYDAPSDSWYMMHVGSFPRPTVVFPLGGPPGQPLALKFLGDAAGPIDQTIPIPPGGDAWTIDIFAGQAGLISPTPNRLRIDSCANIFSTGANHAAASAMPVAGGLPVALNGILATPGQHDYFRFPGKSRDAIEIHVIARELRSPMDSVLTVYDDKGRQLAANDDQPQSPDSYLHFVPSADGQYIVGIADQLGRGGPEYCYRIELTHSSPSLSTSLAIPRLSSRDTYLQTVSVPRGNRFAAVVRIVRGDFNGPVRLSAVGLPTDVKMLADPIPAGAGSAAVIFQATDDAKLTGALIQLQVDSIDAKHPVSGGFHLGSDLAEFNNSPLHHVDTDRLALAVTDPSPISIRVDEPKSALLQDGSMDLHVHVDRKKGFKGVVSLRLAETPRGIQPARVRVGPDQSDAVMNIGAEPRAAAGKLRLCLRGVFDQSGQMMVASDFFTVDVREPAIRMQLPSLQVAAGSSTTVTCPIDQQQALTGPAKVELLGLPPGCTANDVMITGVDKEAKFTIVADTTCRAGTQPGVFLRVSFTQNGEPIVLNIGRGATLRITSAHPGAQVAVSAKEGK